MKRTERVSLKSLEMLISCTNTDPTQQQADPSKLPAQIQALQTDVDEAKWQLGAKRIELAGTLTQLLKTNAQLMQTAIRILEQVVHGSVGRHTRARAEHLATVARGLEKRLLVARKTVAGQVYDERAEEQLRGKKGELEARSAGLRRRLRDREQWLERLEGVAGLKEAVDGKDEGRDFQGQRGGWSVGERWIGIDLEVGDTAVITPIALVTPSQRVVLGTTDLASLRVDIALELWRSTAADIRV